MSRTSDSESGSGCWKSGSGLIAKSALACVLCLTAHDLFAQVQRNPFIAILRQPPGDAPAASTISREVKDVFARAARAVVKIHGVDEHSDIFGTGFFVDPTGTLYTAYSVGGEADNFSVEFNGKNYPARQVVADVRSGIAILKIDEVTPALPIGNTRQLEVATPVITIGYPLDLPKTPSFGMIAGFD